MKLFIIFLLIPALYVYSQDETGISGKYKTTAFMQPAPGDSLMDLNRIGGYMELDLRKDSSFRLLLFIPDHKEFNIERIELAFEGRFELLKDTIKFFDSGFALLEDKMWMYDDKKIRINEKIRDKNLEIVFKRTMNN